MHTPALRPDHARAERLHAILKRRCARFRAALATYEATEAFLACIKRQDPEYADLRAIQSRALRRMHIIHRQTSLLVRMEIHAVGIGRHDGEVAK